MRHAFGLGLICAVGQALPAQQRFADTAELLRGHAVWSVAAHDIDSDGDLDVLAAVSGGWPKGWMMRTLVNDGDGSLTDETASRVPKTGLTYAGVMAVGDVDGDKDLDIVVGNGLDTRGFSTRYLLLNDGKGVFRDVTAKQMPKAWTDYAQDMEFVDIDADGDLDLILAIRWGISTGPSLVYVNNGKGVFVDETAKRLPLITKARSVEVGDLDGDGDVDLMFSHDAKVASPNAVYDNNGKGFFKRSSKGLAYAEPTHGLFLRDFDRDGDLDAFLFAHLTDKLYLNDGQGNFKDESWRLPKPNGYFGSGAAVVADFDGNGALDLIVSASGGISYPGHRDLYLNDGRGRFKLVVAGLPWRPGGTGTIAAADLDGDGDVDVLAERGMHFPPLIPRRLLLWSNLDRHLVSKQSPRIGQTYSLDLYSIRAPALVLPYMATGRARIPIPGIGMFRLDPVSAFGLGAYVLQTPGKLTLPLRVAPDTRLIGLALSSQAAIYETKAKRFSGFTNALTEKVR